MSQPGSPYIDLAHEAEFRLGCLRISPPTREVSSAQGDEQIEPRVMQVLVCLAKGQGTVISRDDLIRQCWSGRAVSEDAINRCISKIRQLADGVGGCSFTVETIPRVGYRLSSSISARADKVGNDVRSRNAILVLPFVNISDDPQQEYFADGITEDITTDLQRISSLFIIARNTAFTFKGKSVDVAEICRHLDVTHVLEGSVRKVGNRVRITAQLIDGSTGGHLWAERYDRDLNDIFAVQDEISRAIVRALRISLLKEEELAIGRRGTENAEAYQLYLMARQTYINSNEADDRAADIIVRLCTRATEIDPYYASAWALMALGQLKLRYMHGTGDGGLAAAKRALVLDAGSAEAHAVLGPILLDRGCHEEALAEIAEALRLSPDSYEVNRAAGLLAYRERRIEDAARYWEKAALLMDTDLYAANLLISCYHALNDPDGVSRAARLGLGRSEKVLAQDQNNGTALSYSAYALAALGEAERAKERMQRALLIDPENVNRRYNFACSLVIFLKDVEAALEVLRPAVARMGRGFVEYARSDPDLDPLRGDPRFEAMLSEADARLAAPRASDRAS